MFLLLNIINHNNYIMKKTITILGVLCIGFFAFGFNLSEENKSNDNITIENESKADMNEDLRIAENNTSDPCRGNGGYLCVQDEYFCMFYQGEWKQNEYGKVFYKWKCDEGHVDWNTFEYLK